MKFSERMGYVPPSLALKENEISGPLRNKLWNACYSFFFSKRHDPNWGSTNYDGEFRSLCQKIRFHIFKTTIDDLNEYPDDELKFIRDWFMDAKFQYLYDFVEEIPRHADFNDRDNQIKKITGFRKICNIIFQDEKACFRFVDRHLTKITSDEEISEVERAALSNSSFSVHISSALELYSKRPKADLRNSIKESISAVESAAKTYCNDTSADLEKALAKLNAQIGLHPQVLAAFKNLYRWTSSSDGIRHAMMEEPNLTEHEARFMIIACSAFCNLLAASQSKQ